MFVEIYGTPNCHYCKMAKDLMDKFPQHKYIYTDITDLEARANMNLRLSSPARTVPQIWVDGEHFPLGFNQLAEHMCPAMAGPMAGPMK